MTISVAQVLSFLVTVLVPFAVGVYAKKAGWVGGSGTPTVPDLVPGHPAINLAVKAVVAKLLDPNTQGTAAALLRDAEVRLLTTYRPEIAARFPDLAVLLDQLTAQPTPAPVPAAAPKPAA